MWHNPSEEGKLLWDRYPLPDEVLSAVFREEFIRWLEVLERQTVISRLHSLSQRCSVASTAFISLLTSTEPQSFAGEIRYYQVVVCDIAPLLEVLCGVVQGHNHLVQPQGARMTRVGVSQDS